METGNMNKKFGEVLTHFLRSASGQIHRPTNEQTDRRTDRQTFSSQIHNTLFPDWRQTNNHSAMAVRRNELFSKRVKRFHL